jgi:hypothetical protein
MRAVRAARETGGSSHGDEETRGGNNSVLYTPGPVPRYIAKQTKKRTLQHSTSLRSTGAERAAASGQHSRGALTSTSNPHLPAWTTSDPLPFSSASMGWGNWRLPRAVGGGDGLQLLVGFEVDVGDGEQYWNHSTTHYDTSKYSEKHKRIEEAIKATFDNGRHKVGFYDRPPPARCGAFEIMLTLKDPGNDLSHIALHSKLCSSKFPNVKNVIRRIHSILGIVSEGSDDADEDEPALPLLGSPSSSPGAAAVSADKRSKPKLPCGKCGGTSYNKCTPIWNQHCRVPKRATRPESAGAGGSSSRNRRKNTATTTIDHGQSARAGVGGGPKKKKRPPAGTFGPPDYSEPVGASSSDDSTALYADANPLVYKSLSSGLTRYDMRWIGDCCSDRCMHCGWTFLPSANHPTACLPWRGPWKADYRQGNWGTTSFSCKHFPSANYERHVGSMRPVPGTQATRRIFFDVVDSIRTQSAYPEAQCELVITSEGEYGTEERREDAAHFGDAASQSSLQYVDVPVPCTVSVHVNKLRYTQVNYHEPFDVSYDSPALVTIAMKFDSSIHVLVRDVRGESLHDADIFMTEVVDAAAAAATTQRKTTEEFEGDVVDDDETERRPPPRWVLAQPGEPPLLLKHPDCKATVEIPAFYAFKASFPYYAQQTLVDPVHFDFKNWHDIGTGVLERELRMVHLEIYVDIVDSDGNQCNGAVMELSCESSGERYEFVNKTGKRTCILRSLEDEPEPGAIKGKLKRWTAQASFRGYNVSYVEVGSKRLPASHFELSAADWPHGSGGSDRRQELLSTGPLHVRLVAIKYAMKVYFRSMENEGSSQLLPEYRSVHPANAKVTLVSSQGKTIELHVGPSCVNMFTIDELDEMAGEYTISVHAPGWKPCVVRVGDRDLPSSPDALFTFDADSVFPPGVSTATMNVFMRYTPVPRLSPSFSTVGPVRLASNGVDLCFVIDATGSMGRYLKALRGMVHTLVDSLYDRYPDMTVRVAVIAYKDLDPESEDLSERPVEKLDFTTDVHQVESFVGNVHPQGGGDIPEDMLAGLDEMSRLSWDVRSTRLAFVIADAPCHGQRFHPFPDAFPDEPDPHGLTAEGILSTLDDHGVRLYFPRINAATSQMIEEFRRTKLLETIEEVSFDDGEDELPPVKLVARLQAIVTEAVSNVLFTAIRVAWSFPNDFPVNVSHFELVRRCCIDDFEKGHVVVVPGDAREHELPVPVSLPFAVRVRAFLNLDGPSEEKKKMKATSFSNVLETMIEDAVVATPASDALKKGSMSEKTDTTISVEISALCDEQAAQEVGRGNAQVVREAWLTGLARLNGNSWITLAGESLQTSTVQLPEELADDHGHPGADTILSQVTVDVMKSLQVQKASGDWDAGDHGIQLNLPEAFSLSSDLVDDKFEWAPISSGSVAKWEGWEFDKKRNCFGAGEMTYDVALRLARLPEELFSKRTEKLPPLSEGIRASLEVSLESSSSFT